MFDVVYVRDSRTSRVTTTPVAPSPPYLTTPGTGRTLGDIVGTEEGLDARLRPERAYEDPKGGTRDEPRHPWRSPRGDKNGSRRMDDTLDYWKGPKVGVGRRDELTSNHTGIGQGEDL